MNEELSPCGLIFAYRLDGKGGGLALDLRGCLVPEEPLLSGIHWLHFDGHHQGARLWLRGESGLDSVAIDGLLGRNPRPRVSVTGDQVLLSLRGLSMEPSSPEDDMLSVQVWTNGARIITCRDRPAQAIADLRRDIEHGQGPTDTGEFLSQLAERLVSAMDDLIAGAEADTDRLGQTGPGAIPAPWSRNWPVSVGA